MPTANSSQSAPVRFRFKNIGPVKEAELELGDLTVIAGRNNTGKTYIVYTLYGFLKSWMHLPTPVMDGSDDLTAHSMNIGRLASEVIETGQARLAVDRKTLNQGRRAVIRGLARFFSEEALHDVFSSRRDAFEKASIEVDLDNDLPEDTGFHEISLQPSGVLSIQYDGKDVVINMNKVENQREFFEIVPYLSRLYLQFLFPELPYNPFVLSAERFGISLFYRELDFTKNNLVDLLQRMGDYEDRESSFPFLFIDRTTSRYALPIKDNIDYTRSIPDLQKERSQIYGDKLFDDVKDMMEGYYRNSGGDIRFISKGRGERRFDIPLHLASSSARGLSDLYFFLRYVAERDHLLIIDEPESHLDTANQILLARLLAQFVRAGLKVLITTHSDYLIKEINNLVMLSRSFADKDSITKKLKYKADDFLEPDSIRAYVAESNGLNTCVVDEFGIEMPVFDTTIDQINKTANELASRLVEDGEASE